MTRKTLVNLPLSTQTALKISKIYINRIKNAHVNPILFRFLIILALDRSCFINFRLCINCSKAELWRPKNASLRDRTGLLEKGAREATSSLAVERFCRDDGSLCVRPNNNRVNLWHGH